MTMHPRFELRRWRMLSACAGGGGFWTPNYSRSECHSGTPGLSASAAAHSDCVDDSNQRYPVSYGLCDEHPGYASEGAARSAFDADD